MKTFCFSPVDSLISARHFTTWMNEMNLQRHSTTAVEFSCACVRPPVLFDAFMFHPSGMDTQPGADGLTNFKKRLNTANKQIKELIGQCIKKKTMSVYELYGRRTVLYMLGNDYTC